MTQPTGPKPAKPAGKAAGKTAKPDDGEPKPAAASDGEPKDTKPAAGGPGAGKPGDGDGEPKAGKPGEPGDGPPGDAGNMTPDGAGDGTGEDREEHERRLFQHGPGPDTTGDNLVSPGPGDPDPGTGRPKHHVGPWPPASQASPGSCNPPQPGQPAVGDGTAPAQKVPAYDGDDQTVIGADETPDYG